MLRFSSKCCLSYENIIEPVHIFYKELPVNEENIVIVDITEKNEVENVKFKKSFEYAVSGLSINQEIDSNLIAVIDTNRQNVLSNLVQKLVKKKEPDLDLKIYNEEMTLHKIIPFHKKMQLSYC